MQKQSLITALLLALSITGFAQECTTECNTLTPHGWSFDLGGQYTWLSFTTPPTFKGSTGGAQARITYQEPDAFFGQLRSVYNSGTLSSSITKSVDKEWYSEFVAGYCFSPDSCWAFTPYVGFGVDFLNDHKSAYSTFSAITLRYRTYYALFGFDARYFLEDWSFGLQAEGLPICQQYLSIGGLPGAAWTMNRHIGAAVRLPIGYSVTEKLSLELAPYYRFFPIGASSVLLLPERILNQWGAFVTLRFSI